MFKALRVVVGLSCLIGLLYIRFRESELFYDPLINFYHGDYQNNRLPEVNEIRFYTNLIFRYLFNMLLSIGFLWAIFKNNQILKFSSLMFLVAGVVLIIAVYFLIQNYDGTSYLPLFYVRRFLIQPLIVFLLIPAFFYARKVNQ